MLSSKPHLAWSPKIGEFKGGQTDPNHAGPSPHVISGGQPFESTHLEWEHSSGMGVPSEHSEVRSAKLEHTPSVVAQKRPPNAKSHQGGYPSSPEQETPLLAFRTLGMILLFIQSLSTRAEACKCQAQW